MWPGAVNFAICAAIMRRLYENCVADVSVFKVSERGKYNAISLFSKEMDYEILFHKRH